MAQAKQQNISLAIYRGVMKHNRLANFIYLRYLILVSDIADD